MRIKKINMEIQVEKLDLLKKELSRGSNKSDMGKIFTLIRESLNYKQSDFARKLGVEAMTISRWENNKIKTPFLTLEQCQNLNYELSRLNLSVLDLPDIMVMVNVSDLKTLGLVNTILATC